MVGCNSANKFNRQHKSIPAVFTSAVRALHRNGIRIQRHGWAAWCGPCRMLSGVIQQLANESDGSYRVGKVNVDEQPELAKRFGIASIPTVILFRNGEAVQRQMGVAPKAAFLNMLQEAK